MEMINKQSLGEERHPSTSHMVDMIAYNPQLNGASKVIASYFWEMTCDLITILDDSPELTAGLRKLLEAKDCLIRASLIENPVDYRDR